MGDEHAIGGIAFLAGSETRVRILDELRERRRIEKSDLQGRLDCSRTTVGRNLDALEERGFIERTNTEVTITRVGEFVAADFFDLVEIVEITQALEPFLEWAPPEEFDPALLGRLADAEMIVATRDDPHGPDDAHVERIETTAEQRFVLPIIGERGMERSLEMLQANRTESVELVIDSDIAELFVSHPRYTEKIGRVLDTGRVTIFVHEEDITYFLGIYDEIVHVAVVDEQGRPRALLETTDDEVRTWADERYREYKRMAEPFEAAAMNEG